MSSCVSFSSSVSKQVWLKSCGWIFDKGCAVRCYREQSDSQWSRFGSSRSPGKCNQFYKVLPSYVLMAVFLVNLGSKLAPDEIFSFTCPRRELLGISGRDFLKTRCLPVQPTLPKHWRKLGALTSASGPASSFLQATEGRGIAAFMLILLWQYRE